MPTIRRPKNRPNNVTKALIESVRKDTYRDFPDGCPKLPTGKRHALCMHMVGCHWMKNTGSAGHVFRVRIQRVDGKQVNKPKTFQEMLDHISQFTVADAQVFGMNWLQNKE